MNCAPPSGGASAPPLRSGWWHFAQVAWYATWPILAWSAVKTPLPAGCGCAVAMAIPSAAAAAPETKSNVFSPRIVCSSICVHEPAPEIPVGSALGTKLNVKLAVLQILDHLGREIDRAADRRRGRVRHSQIENRGPRYSGRATMDMRRRRGRAQALG